MTNDGFSGKVKRAEAVFEGRSVEVNEAENALVWLLRRKAISEVQFAAGEKLRTDFTLAGADQRITASWDEQISSGARGRNPSALSYSEAAAAARRRFDLALDFVGLELSGILVEVCCNARGLEQVERRLNLPARAGKAVLKLALTALARHYGLIASPKPRAMVHSARPDYRPAITPPHPA